MPTGTTASPGPTADAGYESRRILLVDDEQSIRFALGRYLEAAGYRVDAASEREEAEALVTTYEYFCVILDLRLSAVGLTDGLDLTTFVRSRNPRARILLLTAYGSAPIEKEARERGVDAMLPKPQPLDRLRELLGEWETEER